jgi:hypothetical protein
MYHRHFADLKLTVCNNKWRDTKAKMKVEPAEAVEGRTELHRTLDAISETSTPTTTLGGAELDMSTYSLRVFIRASLRPFGWIAVRSRIMISEVNRDVSS